MDWVLFLQIFTITIALGLAILLIIFIGTFIFAFVPNGMYNCGKKDGYNKAVREIKEHVIQAHIDVSKEIFHDMCITPSPTFQNKWINSFKTKIQDVFSFL